MAEELPHRPSLSMWNMDDAKIVELSNCQIVELD